MAAQLISFLYNAVDRMFVSSIEGCGMEALAALGIVLPITIILQAFANLVRLGGSPRASMKLGEGKKEEANLLFNNSFSLLFVLSLILSVSCFCSSRYLVSAFGCPEASLDYADSYLKVYSLGIVFVLLGQGLNSFVTAQGKSLLSMATTLIGAVLNIGLDPLFIFVFKLGVQGAALATVLSQFVSFLWVILLFFRKSSQFHFRFKDMVPRWSALKSILSLGLSPFIMTATECLIQIVFNINLNWASGGNKDYTAALTIMLSALQLISLPLNGIGYGMQPFMS